MRLRPRIAPSLRRGLLLSFLCWLPAGALFAQHASGTFESGGATLEVRDAYAFRDRSSFGDEEVLVVAVSNAGFVAGVLDEYWDRRRAIETYFLDDNTGIVYFEFALDGGYRGLSYYWGPGNGCGYCGGGDVVSSVKLAKDTLTGSLSSTEDGRSFRIDLDVAVSGNDHGAAQGTGGGAPGAAYLVYHQALGSGDRSSIKSHLSAERRGVLGEAEAAGDLDGFLAFLSSNHPGEVRVTEGYVQDGHALLLVSGEGAYGKVEGEVSMALEDGAWRFEEETLSPADE